MYVLRFLGPKLKPPESKFPGVCVGIYSCCFSKPPRSFDQPGLENIAGEFGKDAETQAFPE